MEFEDASSGDLRQVVETFKRFNTNLEIANSLLSSKQ